ncbi:hypothetical protein D3C72_2270680 [compost metagenome]
MGRKIAKGSTSAGMPTSFSRGWICPMIRSMAPEARKTEMATIMPTIWGMIRMAVSKPSLAPSVKVS